MEKELDFTPSFMGYDRRRDPVMRDINRRDHLLIGLGWVIVFVLLLGILCVVISDIRTWPVFDAPPMSNEEACRAVGYQQSPEVKDYCAKLAST